MLPEVPGSKPLLAQTVSITENSLLEIRVIEPVSNSACQVQNSVGSTLNIKSLGVTPSSNIY